MLQGKEKLRQWRIKIAKNIEIIADHPAEHSVIMRVLNVEKKRRKGGQNDTM